MEHDDEPRAGFEQARRELEERMDVVRGERNKILDGIEDAKYMLRRCVLEFDVDPVCASRAMRDLDVLGDRAEGKHRTLVRDLENRGLDLEDEYRRRCSRLEDLETQETCRRREEAESYE